MKPGYLTSELHLLAAAIGLDAGGVTPHGPAQWATVIAAGLYALSRGLAKIGSGQPLNIDATKLLDGLFGKQPVEPAPPSKMGSTPPPTPIPVEPPAAAGAPNQ